MIYDQIIENLSQDYQKICFYKSMTLKQLENLYERQKTNLFHQSNNQRLLNVIQARHHMIDENDKKTWIYEYKKKVNEEFKNVFNIAKKNDLIAENLNSII